MRPVAGEPARGRVGRTFHSFKTRRAAAGTLRGMLQKLSPVLFVDAIAPALPFFVDRLGFVATLSVPLREGSSELGFVILQRDAVEIMLQTRASVRGDVRALADEPNRAMLYVEVADLEPIVAAVAGCEVVVPRRRTFYGADEIGVRAPGGHVLLFAQHVTA